MASLANNPTVGQVTVFWTGMDNYIEQNGSRVTFQSANQWESVVEIVSATGWTVSETLKSTKVLVIPWPI